MFDRVLNTPLVITGFLLQTSEHFLVAAYIGKQPSRGVLTKICSYKYAANLQENTHAEV